MVHGIIYSSFHLSVNIPVQRRQPRKTGIEFRYHVEGDLHLQILLPVFCLHERTIRVLSLGKCASTHTQKKSLVYSLIEFKERYLFKGVLVGDTFKASSLNRLIEL